MATIKVELDAFYGYGHGGGCYGSNETIEVDINDQELDALRKLGAKEISCEAVMETIESGDTSLQSLHERLEEKFYYMVEEYWLYEAYNEFLYECLERHMKQDISDGLYQPTDSKDDFDDEDEESYELNKYYNWVKEHDHYFVADRVGLDLDACKDDEVDYTITFSEQCLWILQKFFITATVEKRGVGRTDWRDIADDVM